MERRLSLDIDLCHWHLDNLPDTWHGQLRRWYWTWRLRRLERQIPARADRRITCEWLGVNEPGEDIEW